MLSYLLRAEMRVNSLSYRTMNKTEFVYGSEMQGRGYTNEKDIIFGLITTAISLTASIGAVVNLYLIKNLKAFHNAFGFFWAVRTVGELGSDIIFGIFTGPVTILQTTKIPAPLGIFAYQLSFTFTYIQCVMNLAIALNRFVAVCYPLRYKAIFNKKLCVFTAAFVVLQALFVVTLYFIFPCNHIGYGPRFYSNVFIKCTPDLDRDYSLVSRYLYRVCFTVACFGTGIINFVTFCKIILIQTSSQINYNNKTFKRDVRLFTLGVVQDILMTIVALSIILCNNEQKLSVIGILLSYDGLIFIYVFNWYVLCMDVNDLPTCSASMVFCNPECRRFLFSKKSATGPLTPRSQRT
uniref:7TM_GPCR_Srx domain-containing protein n=1 Tax=Steinernema glaseri TaxID=37863 RepID=A0A1I8AHG2_9BILA